MHGLLDALGSGRAYATSDMRQCPAHDDGRPSLHVSRGDDGRVLVRCFASCDWRAIVTAIGVPARYLYSPPPVDPAEYAAAFLADRMGKFREVKRSGGRGKGGQDGQGKLVGVHDYGSIHRVMRYRKGNGVKDMVWETKRDGVWLPGLFGVKTSELPIYFERDVVAAVALGDPVILCESESSCDQIIRETGILATTWAGGANAVQVDALRKVLDGYSGVVVIPDNDAPGLAALDTLRAAGLAPARVMPAEGEDARDLLGRIGADKFRALVEIKAREPLESRPTWMPTATEATR